jgi:hypothetical protein
VLIVGGFMNKLLKLSVSVGALCFALSSCASPEPLTREEQFLKSISEAQPDFYQENGESTILQLADTICTSQKSGNISVEQVKEVVSGAVNPEVANDLVDIAIDEYC